MADRVIPKLWLPPSSGVKRVVMHWTAGNYTPNWLDRAHYHFVVTGKGEILKGPRAPGKYLPHIRNLNTGSVGLSLCAMRNADKERKRGVYSVPLTEVQWERACQAAADILAAYGLTLSERTLLCHSEAERVYGVTQAGKWDVDVLPWDLKLTPSQVHAQMRNKTAWYLRTYHGVKTEVVW